MLSGWGGEGKNVKLSWSLPVQSVIQNGNRATVILGYLSRQSVESSSRDLRAQIYLFHPFKIETPLIHL